VRVVLVESPIARSFRPFVRYSSLAGRGPGPDHRRAAARTSPASLWDRILYNQNVHRIRAALVGRKTSFVLDTSISRVEL